MFKKTICLIAFIVSTLQYMPAQSNNQAEKALTDLLSTLKTSVIKTNFKLIVSENGNPIPQSSNGSFTLKDNKFILEMTQMRIWFDGKTQWAYDEGNNEVTITEPTEKEVSETNPMAIISSFKSKSSIRFANKGKTSQNNIIELTPKSRNKEISKLLVEQNKASGHLMSIKMYYQNGNTTLLTLSNFQKGLKISEAIFVFNKTKFKDVTLNDLR